MIVPSVKYTRFTKDCVYQPLNQTLNSNGGHILFSSYMPSYIIIATLLGCIPLGSERLMEMTCEISVMIHPFKKHL